MRRKIITGLSAALLFSLSFTSIAQTKIEDSLQRKMPEDTMVRYQPVGIPRLENGEELNIFTKVDVPASVDMHKWRMHLEKKLQAPITKAAKQGMKAGYYTVNVRFLVEKDGSLTDVKVLNDPGYDLAEASVKVLKTGPQWKPGEQNGRKVRSYYTQPIIFVISEK